MWRDQKKLNETFKGIMKTGGLKSHASWKQANEILIQEQESKENELWKEYIGPVSKDLILKRRETIENGEDLLEKELKKDHEIIKKGQKDLGRRPHKG